MPSKLGIHGIMRDVIIDVLEQLLAAGTTMTTIKAVEGIHWLREVKALSPQTFTVGRYIRGVDREMDVEGPRLDGDLRMRAREVMENLMPKWDAHRTYVDYWEIINEQDPPGAAGHCRLAEFMMHCIDIADAEGYHLGLFSYSLGVPEWDEMKAVVETGVFGKAKAGGHMFALHEYAYPMNVWYGEPLPGTPTYANRGALACRWRWWYEDFLKPRDEVVPLFITEANLARDLPLVTVEEWMEQMVWYDDRMREDSYVVGAHIFTLGSGGGWANYEFTDMLPSLTQHMIAVKDQADAADGFVGMPVQPGVGVPRDEPPVGDECQPREPFKRHYLLLPPDADWRWFAACCRYWEEFRVTLGTAVDEAGYGPGLGERAVTVVNPVRWGYNLQVFFDKHYPGVIYDPLVAESPQALEKVLNARVLTQRRFG